MIVPSATGISNYSGPVLYPPFNTSSIGPIGTAFQITLDDFVLRRGLKCPAYPGRDPSEQFWFNGMSAIRSSGELQDLRSLLCTLPPSRISEMVIRAVPLEGKQFETWVRSVPRQVRELVGHPPPGKRVNAVMSSIVSSVSSGISNYSGPVLFAPFDMATIGRIGTAFEIHVGTAVMRRGVKLPAYPDHDPAEQFWFDKESEIRPPGQSQDLRCLLCDLPASRVGEMSIQSLDMESDSFDKWVRTIPMPVRELAGHQQSNAQKGHHTRKAKFLQTKKVQTRAPEVASTTKGNFRTVSSKISNYTGPMLRYPFTPDDIPFATAFDIVQGDVIVNRVIKLSATNCEVDGDASPDPTRQFWHLNISGLRDGLQDLRPLLSDIIGNLHDLSIRGLPLTPQSFRTWLYRAVPRSVRVLGGECLTLEVDAATRGKRPLPVETGETTVHDSLAPTSPIRKKRFRKPRNVANVRQDDRPSFSASRVMVAEEKSFTEKEDIPLSVRVTSLENRYAHLSRGIGKTFSSLRKLFQD